MTPPGHGGETLDGSLRRRRSIRTLAADPLSDDDVSHILWAAQGVTASWGWRTAPSAGALYPIEVYVATSSALRRYLPAAQRAVEISHDDRRPLIAGATGVSLHEGTSGGTAAAEAPALYVVPVGHVAED